MFLLSALALSAMSSAAVAEKVALRAANGRFLRGNNDGVIRAEAFYPSDKETFELVSCGQQEVILRGPSGRYVMPDPRDGHTLRLGTAATQSDDRERFQLVPVGASRYAFRPHGLNTLLIFSPAGEHTAKSKTPAGPDLRETVEIYRIGELPGILQTALPAVIRGLAVEELSGKQYDKTQKHDTKKYIDLPSPTLKDPTRMKRHQVIGITEEYRIQAQLDGQAEINIPAMSFLANYADGGPGLILLAVNARLPVRGRVEGKIDGFANVSTGYQLTVELSAVAEVAARHEGSSVAFDPPRISDLRVSVSRLKFSNDLLEAAQHGIRHLINRELSRNEERIRKSAESALQKAIASHDVKIPLIGYLGLL